MFSSSWVVSQGVPFERSQRMGSRLLNIVLPMLWLLCMSLLQVMTPVSTGLQMMLRVAGW